MKYSLVFFSFALLFLSFRVLADDEISGKLIIFHAGSLTLPFSEMERVFEAKYPAVDIRREHAGSMNCSRKIMELNKHCDLMASSDYGVIDRMLIPEYADWNVIFASNQMVLCYTKRSTNSKQISPNNWFDILLAKEVKWGYADPNVDPCGYRSLMVMKLAEVYYKKPGLYDKLMASCPKENIRPKSEDQVALLQTGNLDYAWEYLSVAKQHKLGYVALPDEINLGDYRFDDLYDDVVVKVAGKHPGEFVAVRGKSITYGITMVRSAPNGATAVAFMEFLLNPDGGLKVLSDMGQPPIYPCRVSPAGAIEKVPPQLLKFLCIEK